MDEFIKLLDEHLDYLEHEIKNDKVIIYVESKRQEVSCPHCKENSTKTHSLYEKRFQDLPIMGKKSEFVMQNRKMFCLNLSCKYTTFAEPLDFIKPKAKKTNRLLDKIIDVSLNVSSVVAADILSNGVVDVGKSSICELLKKRRFEL